MDRPSSHFRGRPVSGLEAAHANEYFDPFLNATTLKNILGYYRSMCEFLHLKPNVLPQFYPKLRANLTTWRAKALWKKFDARASHKCYGKGKICANTRVLIIGAGPCGLRTAIEAQLLGAKVVVIEKRDRLSRNNVLHLWPFVIEDLRMLGAKKFFGKFCAGAIDHISIRQLQCIMLKVALLLGVEIHTEVSFEKLVEPSATEKTGWRAAVIPENHPVSQYEFDVIIGADGKRNTLQGFKRKEFRGKLAIAITANFINKKTEAEARVEEISGVAFIFNQKFFKDLQEETRIDLENIVYYKDDTHYFVMTAKKASLLEKGVILQDLADTEKLLAPDNVDRDALQNYAREAADFSTNYQMPDLEFAVNHYGQPDVAMFDFTSMYAAEYASKVIEKNGSKVLMILVGDSLLEPFWPTGSGCARGFLSSLDAAWAIRSWSLGTFTPLDVLAERESIYRLLAQTTPDNLNKDWKSYTLDPATRYPNLNKTVVLPHQTICLYETDNPNSIERMKRTSHEGVRHEVPKKRRRGNVDNEVLLSWLAEQLREHEDIQISDISSVFRDGKVLCAIIHHYRPDLVDYVSIQDEDPALKNQLAVDILEKDLGVPPIMTGDELTHTEDYLGMASYLTQVYDTFRGEIPHIKHPKLELPESNKRSEFSFKTIKSSNHNILQPSIPTVQQSRPSSRHKRHADAITQKPGSIDRKMRKRRTLEKVGPNGDHENKLPSITRFAEKADEDIASKIRSLEDRWTNPQPADKKPKDLYRAIGKIETSDWNIKQIEKKIMENKMGKPSSNKDKEKVPKWSKEEFMAKLTKMEKKHLDRQDSSEAKFADIDRNIKHLELKLKEGTARDLGKNKVATITEKLVSKVPKDEPKSGVEKPVEKPPINLPLQSASEFCHFCGKKVYLMEKVSAEGRFFHRGCFKCQYCHTQLRLGSYSFDRDGQYGHKFFCLHHYGMPGELPRPSTKVTRKSSHRGSKDVRSPSKKPFSIVPGLDLVDRVQTPERVEFSNLSTGNISSDHEEPLSQMDEDEWTDKNFGASCAEELDDSDEDSSSVSDTDSDDEDAYDDALEEPVTKEGTMKWAERWKNCFSRKGHRSDSDGYSSSDQSSYYDSSDDDDTDTATEGEEEIRARELRMQEFRVEPPVVQTDTGTDTEIVSDETTSESSSEILNSATEISTDSEFAQDDPTPTREIPAIVFNDFYVTKTRGSNNLHPKKIQVKSGYIQRPLNDKNAPKKTHIELKLKPLVPPSVAPIAKKPALNLLPRTEGYALNRTQSTGGIAAKVSLELKKKYLLGEPAPGNIQKSGSASTLDTKFRSFQSTISDCQKLLKPAPEISASMQVFCNKLNERHSPVLSPQSSQILVDKEIEQKDLPPPDITITTIKENKEAIIPKEEEEEKEEERSRSPVHEASIVVPNIDWSKKNDSQSSDSLSLTSSSENERNFNFENIPRVEVHTALEVEEKEDIPLDSLCMEAEIKSSSSGQVQSVPETPKSVSSLSNEIPKSITSEKKTLNQPKSLPDLEKSPLPEIHKALHVKIMEEKEDSPENEIRSLKALSDRSSPEATAALTETELSDWARDGNVSDDIEFDFSHSSDMKPKKVAKLAEMEELNTKENKEVKNRNIITETMSTALSANLDSIEFMDTGTETSSDDGIVDSQNGYVLFHDEDELAADSLDPNINEVLETRNIYITGEPPKNTGFCTIAPVEETNRFGSEVIDLKPADLEKLKQKHTTDHDEDSLLILDTGTTTEENTCSDSTVKNVTELAADNREKEQVKLETLQKQRLEEKLAKVKAEQALLKEQKQQQKPWETVQTQDENVKFEEHCHRLQSKVEFGNARDSIDIRKSRRKSKTEILQKPDLIQEEKERPSSPQRGGVILNLSPDLLYKRENIKKERDVNQKLIQEMVMNKMKAENKSLERKKRNRTPSGNLSPNRPYELAKSHTTDVVSQINMNNLDKSSSPKREKSPYITPDLLSNSVPQKKSVVPDINSSNSTTPLESENIPNTRPLSVFSTFSTDPKLLPETPLTHPENFSLPDIRKNLFGDDFKTPTAPPRLNRGGDAAKTAEKLRENARVRARLLSNEDLGLSPEDKLTKLKLKASKRGKENEVFDSHVQESIESLVINNERRNSQLYSNDTLTKKKNNSFRRSKSGDNDVKGAKLTTFDYDDLNRTKSVSEIPKQLTTTEIVIEKNGKKNVCKSDPNLLDTDYPSNPKKKSKDRERRRSITKIIANIFKKSPGSGEKSKGLFARLSPKTKEISKSCVNLDLRDPDVVKEEPIRRKSVSELNLERREVTPPPVPPLPTNYTNKGTDESSEGEDDWKRQSSCDTVDQLDQSGVLECSTSSLNSSRRTSKARKAARQAQLKRHRMAQEIQRKLEETEVKTRELEQRGVQVEKALRGETTDSSGVDGACAKDEPDLLQEWFDLMRDRTELRRYEKELSVRAKELELEDRHARLQHELRDRLESNEPRTEENLVIEEKIIDEMMGIVAKRDSLIAVLEEDRLRYSNEDRDLEEQMLAKGLRLTPIRKSPDK